MEDEDNVDGGEDVCAGLEEAVSAMESQLNSLEESNREQWILASEMKSKLIMAEQIQKEKAQEVSTLQLFLLRERQLGDATETLR